MIIYGSGMAGMLTAHMLRRHKPIIKESQNALPNNHDALLRFRSDKVSIATGIPFKRVKVRKAIKYDSEIITEPNIFLSNMYSKKVTGAYYDRSINNLDPAIRYIAPFNFIELMSNGLDIKYGETLDPYKLPSVGEDPIISTIPMPVMMNIVNWKQKPDFKFKKIWSKRGVISDPTMDIYQTIYYPDKLSKCYRVSITGNIIIAEYIEEPDKKASELFSFLMEDFGIQPKTLNNLSLSEMKYGKLLPIDDTIRKEFILHMTQKYNIFSVGRFATWRQLLLDDVVDDINVVDNLIGNNYLINLSSKKGI